MLKLSVPLQWDPIAKPSQVENGNWYTLEITALGNHITTAVNGTVVAEYEDPGRPFESGGIALVGRSDATVRIKEIKIQELTPATLEKGRTERPAENRSGASSADINGPGFTPIFNGKDLDGWNSLFGNQGTCSVEDGMLKIDGPKHIGTVRAYRDFHLRFSLRTSDLRPKFIGCRLTLPMARNYGFHFGGAGRLKVFQPGDYHYSFTPEGTAKPTRLTDGLTELKHFNVASLSNNGWHQIDVIALGNVFRMLVDRQEVSAFRDEQSRLSEGPIFFGLPADAHLDIRQIEIKELTRAE
jgi:hypothetical protein